MTPAQAQEEIRRLDYKIDDLEQKLTIAVYAAIVSFGAALIFATICVFGGKL